MKISTKGRYALRLMLDLALASGDSPTSLKDIATRQGISEKYSEQIISALNKAGLVRSIRGAQGGYVLAVPAKECTVGMILRQTEGDLAPVDCVSEGGEGCEKAIKCVHVRIWKKMFEAVNEVIDSITLADMVAWQTEEQNEL